MTIMGIEQQKAQQVTFNLCGQSNLLDLAQVRERLRQCTGFETQQAGLTSKQAAKLQAALALGRRACCEHQTSQTIVDAPSVLASLFASDLMFQPVERFAVVALDVKHHVIAVEVMSQGTTPVKVIVCTAKLR